jgi:hypothetical protein
MCQAYTFSLFEDMYMPDNLEHSSSSEVKLLTKMPLEILLMYLGKKEVYCIFKTYCIISVFSPLKMLFVS